VHWEVVAPVTVPGEFVQVEVPQLVQLGECHHILFSAQTEDHSRQRRSRLGPGQGGTFTFSASNPAGPCRASAAPVVPSDGPLGTPYAGKFIETQPGDWLFLAFCIDRDGTFVGELTDPLPVRQNGNGNIEIRTD
jgi:beta-fructofuranosidase